MKIRVNFASYAINLVTASIGFFLSIALNAQMPAERIQALFDRSRFAVVKITVEGTIPKDDNKIKRNEGSGFFIYSDSNRSFLLTSRHLVGSSEVQQTSNPDWKVENGEVVRKIKIESLDENGTLRLRSDNALVAPIPLPGIDIALLMVEQGGFDVLPLTDKLTDNVTLHDVMLMGFRAGKTALTKPIPSGTGSLVGFSFATSTPSRHGESGGPWIDVQSGKVFALASVVKSSLTDPSSEATPVAFMKPFINSYFQSAGLPWSMDSAVSLASTLKILGSDGQKHRAPVGNRLGRQGAFCSAGHGSDHGQRSAALLGPRDPTGDDASRARRSHPQSFQVQLLATIPVIRRRQGF